MGSEARPAATLAAATDPADMLAAVDGVLQGCVSPEQAARYSKLLVQDQCFDTPEAMDSLTVEKLEAVKIPLGHREIVCKALFSGNVPRESHRESLTVNRSVRADSDGYARTVKPFKVPWPEGPGGRLCSAAQLSEWGFALKCHLDGAAEAGYPNMTDLADEVWERFVDPALEVHPGYTSGGPLDKVLTRILSAPGEKSMPQAISKMMMINLKKGFGRGCRLYMLCARGS